MTDITNPFLTVHHTPHQTFPFHLLEAGHYEPAIRKGIEEQNKEIDAIINNPPISRTPLLHWKSREAC
mgnify:CR=1 FL=1